MFHLRYIKIKVVSTVIKDFLNSSKLVLDRVALPSPIPAADADMASLTSKQREAVKAYYTSLKWFYNSNRNLGDRPADLGYYIGYLISEAYWNSKVKSADELQTFTDIIFGTKTNGSALEFIKNSGIS